MQKPQRFHFLIPLLLSMLSTQLFAQSLNRSEPLRVDDAFPQEVLVQKNNIVLTITMRDHYYLYQHAFKFSSADESITLGELEYPATKTKYDEFIGDTEVYDKDLTLRIPFSLGNKTTKDIIFTYEFQGCLTDGICYPPTTRTLVLNRKGTVNFVGTPIPEEERNTASEIDEMFAGAPKSYAQDKSAQDESTKNKLAKDESAIDESNSLET